jgi:hypothetical protein
MRLAISRTVYPDGRVRKYKKGMELQVKQAPNTDEINKWFKEIHKSLTTPIKWKKHCR